jgi:hypothetical protein
MRTKRTSKKSLTDQASDLVEQMSPHVEAARERIVNDYLPAAQTMLAEARDTAVEVAKDARDAAQEAAVNAEKSTRKSRKRAAKRAKSKARSLAAAAAATPAAVAVAEKVRPESKKPKRKKRVMVLLGLAGLGAFLFKKLKGDSTSNTSTYQPPRPAPAPRPTPVADTLVATTPPAPPAEHFEPEPESTDQGGAFLDEALADASEEPHKVTTPDHPAESEDVSDKPDPKK